MAVNASPLLFINYKMESTLFADDRAGQLGLSHRFAGSFSLADLNGKSAVIMPGMQSYASLLADLPVLTEFVNDGGYLWINLPAMVCGSNIAPSGAGFLGWPCGGSAHNDETVAAPNHEYFTGTFNNSAHVLTAASFSNWENSDSGVVSSVPANATVLLSNGSGPSLVEYSYGKGWVVVSTLNYAFGTGGARTAALDNMLLYAAGQRRGSQVTTIPDPPPVDPGPSSGIPEPSTAFLFVSGGTLLALSRAMRRR
jgi:hypothetical protein